MLERRVEPKQPSAAEVVTLLEPLSLNSEQREAIDHALTRPLTVITGPPGTGKSQVVSCLLINAAKLGKRVLFASKNNKAVDVVEARVNNLGPRPILLRLGRGEYQSKLTEYLTALLASRATEEDRNNHDEAEKDYGQTLALIRELHKAAQETMKLRNDLDAVERSVEPLRNQLGETLFQSLRTLVYVGSYDHNVYAFNASNGGILWKTATGGIVISRPIVAEGKVFVGSEDYRLYTLDASNGEILWSYKTGYYVDSDPAYSNGVVYVGSEDSKIYAFDAENGHVIWSYQTGNQIMLSSVTLSGGLAYLAH